MDDLANSFIEQLGLIVMVVTAYRESFGPQQTELTEAVIKAFNVKARYKPAVNVASSIAFACLIGSVLAVYTSWQVIPIAAVAGLFAATKAADVHDVKKAAPVQ